MSNREPEPAPDLVRGGVTVPGEERQRCDVWTRIMGYYRPKSWANAGKQSEIADRKPFREITQERMEV